MDYKQKYEDALEKAKQFSEKPYLEDSKCIVEYIFPELAESEDERIRKEIISALKYANHKGVYDKHLAWLEKQDEKHQYWKPSEEQLEALDYAYNRCPDTERGNYYEGILGALIDDLHKLSKNQGEQKSAWS